MGTEAALLAWICALTGARAARLDDRIQGLWDGYGDVMRVVLEDGPAPVVVAKEVRPPPRAHPRKLRSYAIEQAFYRDHAPRSAARLPRCFGLGLRGQRRLFVLEDLGAAGFVRPLRGGRDDHRAAALRWLARFHAGFLGTPPAGLWPEGSYWHLATRPDELARMRDARLRGMAPLLDRRLAQARFRTLVHGDAKPANFLVDAAGGAAAAVDFQYVGGGCGMRDVVYFLGGADDAWGLDLYFAALREALGPRPEVDAAALEAEWRALAPVAALDFARFLDGWR